MVRVIFLGARTQRRLRAGAGRMLVSADDGGVDRDAQSISSASSAAAWACWGRSGHVPSADKKSHSLCRPCFAMLIAGSGLGSE